MENLRLDNIQQSGVFQSVGQYKTDLGFMNNTQLRATGAHEVEQVVQ